MRLLVKNTPPSPVPGKLNTFGILAVLERSGHRDTSLPRHESGTPKGAIALESGAAGDDRRPVNAFRYYFGRVAMGLARRVPRRLPASVDVQKERADLIDPDTEIPPARDETSHANSRCLGMKTCRRRQADEATGRIQPDARGSREPPRRRENEPFKKRLYPGRTEPPSSEKRLQYRLPSNCS